MPLRRILGRRRLVQPVALGPTVLLTDFSLYRRYPRDMVEHPRYGGGHFPNLISRTPALTEEKPVEWSKRSPTGIDDPSMASGARPHGSLGENVLKAPASRPAMGSKNQPEPLSPCFVGGLSTT